MRVLQINDYGCSGSEKAGSAGSPGAGGAEAIVRRTAELLGRRGCIVDHFTRDDVPGYRRGPLSYINSARCRAALRARVATFLPDVVHLHNFYHELSPGILAELAWLRSLRPFTIVMTAHDAHLACPNSGLTWFIGGRRHLADPARLRDLGYLLSRRWDHRGVVISGLKLLQHVWNYRVHDRRGAIDRVICPSRFMQEVLSWHGLATAHVPNPIDARPASSSERAAGRGRLQLVFAGRLEPEKGLAEFLNGVPSEMDATLVVLGDGSERGRCEAICAARGLTDRVKFLGMLAPDEARGHIAAGHALILPSLVAENCPMSLLEALASGANIAASDWGGMREIIQRSGVGFGFDPREPASVRQAIERMLAAHAAGTLNRFDVGAFLAEHAEDRYIEQLMTLYRDPTAALSTEH